MAREFPFDKTRNSGFTSVNMSNNTNISSFIEWKFSCHDVLLPAIMSEGFIRLRHFVGLLTFLYGHTLSGGSIHQFTGEFFGHRVTRTATCRLNEPAHGQGIASVAANIYRNLIG